MNCASSSLQTIIAESPIADYVEDLQFSGFKNGNILGTGTASPKNSVKQDNGNKIEKHMLERYRATSDISFFFFEETIFA